MDEKIIKAIKDARDEAVSDMVKYRSTGAKMYVADFLDDVFPDATYDQRMAVYALINFWESNQTIIITGLALGHFTK